MDVASFFSGIGGFDLGLERAGMRVVFQCEKNSFCKEVLTRRWPEVQFHGDINTLAPEQIPDAELWCGGFPCQDLSLANQGKRKGLQGDRSGLFYQFAELLNSKASNNNAPKWIILENVPGLLNSHQGEDFRILLQTLDELGYNVSWRVLDAKFFGTPQRRRRVFVVGALGGLSSSEVLFDNPGSHFSSQEGVGASKTTPQGIRGPIETPDRYIIQHASINRKHTAGPQAKGYRNDGESYTLDSRGGADAVCATNDAFRVRKASRVSRGVDGSRYRALGNAVAVPIIEWLGKRILAVNTDNPAM